MTWTRLLILLPVMILVGCAHSAPHRVGYDRETGSWQGASTRVGSARKFPSLPTQARDSSRFDSTDTTLRERVVPDTTWSGNGNVQRGKASYYARNLRGARTSSGEPYDPELRTCAHRTHPFGTQLRVRYVRTGKVTLVRVNDRGPHKASRVIDLSESAAQDLGMVRDGIGEVEVEVVE